MKLNRGVEMGRRAKYTNEFIAEAVKLVTRGGYTQAEAARNLGVSAKSLNRWVLDEQKGRKGVEGRPCMGLEQEELVRLRKEVKRLRMEREILKKATAFFVNEQN